MKPEFQHNPCGRTALRHVLLALACCIAIFLQHGNADDKRAVAQPIRPAANCIYARRRLRRRAPADASASYGRYSSELQDDTSIEQQRHKCRDFAAREGNPISANFEFADEAVSGTKRYRAGLDALLAAAEQGRFRNLYFFSLSRLRASR